MDAEIYKLFGPISVFVTGLAIVLMLIFGQKDKTLSISQHAAAHKTFYLMMLVVQSITLPMLFLFWAKSLTPIAQLPNLFVVFSGLLCAGLLIAAWIPDTNGWKSKVHQLAAYGAAALAVPCTTMIYLSNHISTFAKYTALAVLIYEIVALTLFAASKEKGLDKHLYVQFAYIFLFAFSTLIAAYI